MKCMRNLTPKEEFEILNIIYNSKYIVFKIRMFKLPAVLSSGISGSISDFIKLLKKDVNDKKIRSYFKTLRSEGILKFDVIKNVNGIDTSLYVIDGEKLNEKMINNRHWLDIQKFIDNNIAIR